MTVEIEADGFVPARRIDAVTVAAIVLTVDAVLFLLIAILGVPALIWLFGDEIASWSRLWLVVVVWLVACALGPLCTAAVMRVTGRGRYSIRRTGTAAAVGTAAATGVLALVSAAGSPGLAGLAALFGVANLAAARVFAKAPEETGETMLAVPFVEPFTPSDVIVADEAVVHPTVDLAPVVEARRPRTRSRGPAALRTLTGVQLPPRARRRR
ncbi:hypothetical protein AB0M02_26455 [Actinoplanes sp. NPDC051861]|uniref:hypothetical protein n=1 Tax=Actinoplanes sp. NPDC051861 TaxID=3155170 RepID=UPI0034496990